MVLPSVRSSFVGRERELKQVTRLLASSRLVTLTGAAGCGKTRLALRAVRKVGDRYEDGVCWVELARLSDPALVAAPTGREIAMSAVFTTRIRDGKIVENQSLFDQLSMLQQLGLVPPAG